MTNHLPTTTLSPALERLARRRVKARMGWFTHALIYIAVISGLSLISVLKGHSLPLPTALGWGVGLLAHGLAVFAIGKTSTLCNSMVESMLQRERARLQQLHTP